MFPKYRPITKEDFAALLVAEESLFESKVKVETLEQWFYKNPEFAQMYLHPEDPNVTIGSSIIIPLKKQAWEDLIGGMIMEHDITKEHIWEDAVKDPDIGLHMYHIEKDPKYAQCFPKRLGILALEDLASVLEKVKEGSPLRICGFSGCTVTKDGFALFSKLYRAKELWRCKDNDQYRMMATKPHEESIVWKLLQLQ